MIILRLQRYKFYSICKCILDKFPYFYPLYVLKWILLTVTRPARLSSKDVRLLQQADGVLLAVGGGEGEEVGGLRAGS